MIVERCFEFMLFNEAEAIVTQTPDAEGDINVKPHQCKRNKRKPLPADLPSVDVMHELSEAERQCSRGCTLKPIGEDIHEQLSLIPQQYFIVHQIRVRYACSCKQQARSADVL